MIKSFKRKAQGDLREEYPKITKIDDDIDEIWLSSDIELFEVVMDEGFAELAACVVEYYEDDHERQTRELYALRSVIRAHFYEWLMGVARAMLDGAQVPDVNHGFYEHVKDIVTEWLKSHETIVQDVGKERYLELMGELACETLHLELDTIMDRNIESWEIPE